MDVEFMLTDSLEVRGVRGIQGGRANMHGRHRR